MRVAELREYLSEMDDDTEIHLAIQPNYPLEATVRGIALVDGVLYLGEGAPVGYLSGDVADEVF
jgi:hypothetical protein